MSGDPPARGATIVRLSDVRKAIQRKNIGKGPHVRVDESDPKHVLVVFDLGGGSPRHVIRYTPENARKTADALNYIAAQAERIASERRGDPKALTHLRRTDFMREVEAMAAEHKVTVEAICAPRARVERWEVIEARVALWSRLQAFLSYGYIADLWSETPARVSREVRLFRRDHKPAGGQG